MYDAAYQSKYRLEHNEELREYFRRRYRETKSLRRTPEYLLKQRAWQIRNRKRLSDLAKIRYWLDPEKNRARALEVLHRKSPDERKRARAKTYASHRDRRIEDVRRWRVAHPDAALVYGENRRARLSQNGGSFTVEEWRTLKAAYGQACGYCGAAVTLVADHRTPVVRGGNGYIANIIPACWSCNSEKYTRTEAEYRAYLKRRNS